MDTKRGPGGGKAGGVEGEDLQADRLSIRASSYVFVLIIWVVGVYVICGRCVFNRVLSDPALG